MSDRCVSMHVYLLWHFPLESLAYPLLHVVHELELHTAQLLAQAARRGNGGYLSLFLFYFILNPP